MYVYDFHKIQHTLSLGVAMLIGILLIRRDIQRSSYDWFASLPVSSTVWVLTKFIIGLLYLSLFTVVMSLVYIAFAFHREVPVETIMEHTIYFALQYEWSYAVILALAMFLAVIIPNKVSYLIGFCAWMFGTFFIDIFIISRNKLYFLKTFHLNQFFTTSLVENEVWGQGLTAIENGLSKIFVLSFCLLLLAGMILLLKKQRPTKTLRRWTILSLTAFVGCAALFAPYGWLWKERYSAFAERYVGTPMYENENTSITRFQVDGYNIEMERKKNNLLKAAVTIKFPTDDVPPKQVPFTLNHTFHIQKILLNGKEISYIREGDLFTFAHSELNSSIENQTLYIEYEGHLYEWGYEFTETVSAFVQNENVFLPSFVAWYPLPGDHSLYVNSPGYILQNPTSFHVSFKGFAPLYGTLEKEQLEDADNIQAFEGDQVEDFYVFSGRLMEITDPKDSLKVITSPSNNLEAELFLKDIMDMKLYFESWLGDYSQLDQVIYFPLALVGEFYNRNINQLVGNNFIIAQSRHHNLDQYQRRTALNVMLFKDDQTGSSFSAEEGEGYSLIGEVRQLIQYLYYRDHLQMTYEEIKYDHRIPGLYLLHRDEGHPAIQMTNMVEQAIAEGKMKQVKEVLRHFYEKGLTITNDRDGVDYAKITLDDWQGIWDQVMQNE